MDTTTERSLSVWMIAGAILALLLTEYAFIGRTLVAGASTAGYVYVVTTRAAEHAIARRDAGHLVLQKPPAGAFAELILPP